MMQPSPRNHDQREAGLTVAKILLEIEAVNFRPEEPYILTSGWASPVYIDCRKIISFPRARRRITRLAAEAVLNEIGHETIEVVAGGETAGIPFAAWISDALDLPMTYVRKKPKGFGRQAQIEGDLKEGQRALLVEDLTTDGASKVAFCNALREAGAEVHDAMVVFFYGVFPGALKTLEEMDIRLHFLSNWWDVLQVAETTGRLSRETIEEVRAFLHDPVEWSGRNGGRSE